MVAPRITLGIRTTDNMIGYLDIDNPGMFWVYGDAGNDQHVRWAHEDAEGHNRRGNIPDWGWSEEPRG